MNASTNIAALAFDIKDQADRLFPNRTDASMYLKLYGEIAEMITADTPAKIADEVADVLIMVLDHAARKGIDVHTAIARKMAINENRKWVTNALGVNQHVG